MRPVRVVELLGWVLVVAGLLDLAMINTPLQFGNPLWEFGVAAQTVASMVPVLAGMALLVVAVEVEPGRVRALMVTGTGAVLLLALVALGTLAALSVPPFLELARVQDGAAAAAHRVILKTAGLGTIGAVLLMVCTIRGSRRFIT